MRYNRFSFDGFQIEIGSIPIQNVVLVGNKFWVNINGVWKETITWVNVNGVWKQATPFYKIGGQWR
jgi:hypothetical protein